MTRANHFEVCGTCHRSACSCPIKQPKSDLPALEPTTKREARAVYQDAHRCVGCIHAGVCEVGRHTAELYVAGWEIRIDECSQFIDISTLDEEPS